MKLGKFRQSKFGFITALCVMIAALLIDLAGGYAPLNGIFENACHRLGVLSNESKNVLMVYAEPHLLSKGSSSLVDLLNSIQQHGPRSIGVVATGKPRYFQTLDRLPYAQNITVGFPFEQLLSSYGGKVSGKFDTGFSDLRFSSGPIVWAGVAKREQVGVSLGSFERHVVEKIKGPLFKLSEDEFGMTYCGGAGTIARISAEKLVHGSSVRELIHDKVVLIGPDYGMDFALPVPVGGRMSRLELRANMVECLLQNNHTARQSLGGSVLCLALAVLITIQLARQIPWRWSVAGLFAALAAVALVCLIAIWLFHIWLPAALLSTGVALAYCTVISNRLDTLESFIQYWKMRSIVREGHLESRFEEDVWKAIGDSAYQMFQPTRMVMMELLPGATHLKRVRSIGCDYSQIYEKRLDYKRSPYFEALEQNRPIINPHSHFFIATPGLKEVEYVLPMTNGLTVLGIIVIGMDQVKLERWADFETFLARFTEEMSQLIAGSRRESEDDPLNLSWVRRLQKLPEEREFLLIQRNSGKQSDLIERADLAFDGSESAMATFDIYGRAVRRNSNFNRVMQEAQLSISNASCTEIMAALTGRSQNLCRKIFRQAILDERGETLLIDGANTNANSVPRVMYVKPMHLIEEERRASIETHGLLIEIVDGAQFADLSTWSQSLTETIYSQATEHRDNLDTHSKTIANIASQAKSPQEALMNLFGAVGSTVDEIVSVLQQCKELTERNVNGDSSNCFAVEAASIWDSVVQSFDETLDLRSIKMTQSCDVPQIMVWANPLLLKRVFETVIEFLIGNAFDDSELTVKFNGGGQRVVLQVSNQGGGTPIESLRRSLQVVQDAVNQQDSNPEVQNLTPAQSDQLTEIQGWVSQWGGEIGLQSTPDSMTVTINLLKRDPRNDSPDAITDSSLDADTHVPSIGNSEG